MMLVACSGDVEIAGDSASSGLSASCSDGEPVDEFVAGLSRDSSSGLFDVVLLDANPAPPDVGNNVFHLQVDGAERVTVRPWMPLHGHGTVPDTFEATQETDGTWTTPDVDLFMPGLWELEFVFAEEESALFRFCLEG